LDITELQASCCRYGYVHEKRQGRNDWPSEPPKCLVQFRLANLLQKRKRRETATKRSNLRQSGPTTRISNSQVITESRRQVEFEPDAPPRATNVTGTTHATVKSDYRNGATNADPIANSNSLNRTRSAEVIDLTEEGLINIKEEPHVPGIADLSDRTIHSTMLYVTIDRLSHRSRVPVLFKACCLFESFFENLMVQSGIPASHSDEIKRVNITFNWRDKNSTLCLQRRNRLHWLEFCRKLRLAWTKPAQFEGGICEVDVQILADDKGFE
jgi:hypothetical protein